MRPKVVAVVPARLGSTRFPNKVIYPLHGKPLLYYLVRALSKSKKIDRLIVATDSRKIRESMEAVGIEVMMTSPRHGTGSDRVAEIAPKIKGDLFLNIQADNLGLKAVVLDRIIAKFVADRDESFATLVTRATNDRELSDPNTVKAAVSADGYARWFSRFPIPYLQRPASGPFAGRFRFHRHIGIYLFRRDALLKYASWRRGVLEQAESLEQLRILENGEQIRAYATSMRSISIDSPQDLEKVRM
jgi:3-deoxy-manno-octulosonate cytidylyltransferase (CMP-KDO synthetase)